jgi:hypothetical protein
LQHLSACLHLEAEGQAEVLREWTVADVDPVKPWRVAYLLTADNVSGPLLTRLKGVNQPVIRTGNEFSRPRLALLASI